MSEENSSNDGSCSTPSNTNNNIKNSDWAQFLAQRQKRKQLIKQKKDKESNELLLQKSSSYSPTTTNNHPHITSRKLQKSPIYSPSSTPTITDHIKHINGSKNNDNNSNRIKWIDLYEDVIYHICTFCNLQSLLNISITCSIWNKYSSYLDETKWRLWYNAINYEMKNIHSLDRTGKSNHFIITQNAFDSYDSVYHFAKFAKFSKYLIPSTKSKNSNSINYNKQQRQNETNTKYNGSLFESLIKINKNNDNDNGSISRIRLFIDKLHKNILYEYKDKSKDEEEKENSKSTNNGSLSLANPELIYINNSYDTASDTETSTTDYSDIELYQNNDDNDDDIIIIDDHEYNHNDKDIILIRNNMKNIVKFYKYLKYCINDKNYLKLLHLFKNIILIESRPILRYFLFILDRSQCFNDNKNKTNNDKNDKNNKNIGDVTVFLKCLENYIREIHSIINISKQSQIASISSHKLIRYFNSHQQYLLQMCVDVDEVRARGISSLQYWLRSGTMVCNPDL